MTPTTKSIALVTGGNRGLGRATAIALARTGYEVIITSRSVDSANAAFSGVSPELRPARILGADITNEADRIAIADHLESTYGVLDLLINTA